MTSEQARKLAAAKVVLEEIKSDCAAILKRVGRLEKEIERIKSDGRYIEDNH